MAGLTGGGALLAHFCALDAARLTAFAAGLRTGEADLFAELARICMQLGAGFAQARTGQAHVMAGRAHL